MLKTESSLTRSPDLTVLLTVFNGADHIARTIDSFVRMDAALCKGQVSHRVEVVIVDDGSDDGSGEVLRDKLGSLGAISRLRYVRLFRSGRAIALNVGLDLCETDLLSIHDVDDTFHPNRFDEALEAFDRQKFDLFIPGGDVCDIDEEIIRRVRFPKPPSELAELLRVVCPHTFWTWNRESFAAMSGYNEGQDRLIDFEAFLRAKRLGRFVLYVDQPAGRHYKYDSFFARKIYSESQKEFRRLLKLHFNESNNFYSSTIALLALFVRRAVVWLGKGRYK